MTIRELILKEIAHRKLSFAVGLFSVVIAVACLVGAFTLLSAHDLRTERIIELKEAATREEMARMEDDYRKIMRRLGYNVLILHKDQDLADLHARGHANKYFPLEWATRLADGKIETLNHLLPVLQQKIVWPERRREIVLTGIHGQVPLLHRRIERSPIMETVPEGKADIGHEIAGGLNLSPGDKLTLMGREFVVNKSFPRRGNQDDNTIWINLKQAQEMLNRPGMINGILALECICTYDSLGKIAEEVEGMLPEAQVFEFSSLVIARAEARGRAAEAHKSAIEQEKANRVALKQAREGFASVLAPLVLIGCMVWIALLTYGNVRERRSEIGILRALGVRSGQIVRVFVGKAVLMGLIGGFLGFGVGLLAGSLWGEQDVIALNPLQLFDARLFAAVLVGSPVLAGLAGWSPALLAADQDPARVLREE